LAGAKSDAILPESAVFESSCDNRLAKLIDAWPNLAEDTRNELLRIAESR
jgi:hypothetical protein